ncbi:MAG: N-acyl-D-amino-acid deacylase [uncultured Chloroflexi bacterium]|uniref:N-acyl-D-amino-acid deacylase n=1 Tax=uncultured Chloroflexota bacterium TaxID=166587 RepID=A0A6J4H0U6_9CHLR|nr:MAG: N-acyl-D-amino-acid deacylase [uncultured Chloroflexota bacterium]
MPTFDLVIASGSVVDGSGAPAYRADVGVLNGHIEAIGDLSAAQAAERFDASGCIVSPGFIDPHTHSDLPLLVNPEAHSKVRQGVTTEVIGNCGSSPAPILGPYAEEIRTRVTTAYLQPDWRTYGDYLDRLRGVSPSLNVVPLAGHVTLRTAAMGVAQRPPSTEELDRMREHLVEALDAGAFGMSSGLMTPPSSYADTEELVTLAETLHQHDALYFSHIRGEGNTLFRAAAEAIEVGERAGVPVQIAHHKAAFRSNWGRMPQVTQLSEWAVDRGVDVRFDVYPYTAGSAGLTQLLPDWSHEGGRTALLGRLHDAATCSRVREDVLAFGREWDRIYVTTVHTEANKPLEGKTLAEVAEQRRVEPVDALFALLVEEDARAGMLHFIMADSDVEHVLKHPLSMMGSDGSSLAVEGPLSAGRPHPRSYGCFARVLGHYVREKQLLSLEQAVHKMSGAPAQRLGLRRKGLLRYGMDADVAVFDPTTVIDAATYALPHRYAEGFRCVVVNGHVTVRDGEHTGARAGSVLRRQDR